MPNVTMMSGNVTNLRSGRIKAFTIPKTSATPRNGRRAPEYVTPVTIRVATHNAAALTRRRMTNRIGVSSTCDAAAVPRRLQHRNRTNNHGEASFEGCATYRATSCDAGLALQLLNDRHSTNVPGERKSPCDQSDMRGAGSPWQLRQWR